MANPREVNMIHLTGWVKKGRLRKGSFESGFAQTLSGITLVQELGVFPLPSLWAAVLTPPKATAVSQRLI